MRNRPPSQHREPPPSGAAGRAPPRFVPNPPPGAGVNRAAPLRPPPGPPPGARRGRIIDRTTPASTARGSRSATSNVRESIKRALREGRLKLLGSKAKLHANVAALHGRLGGGE